MLLLLLWFQKYLSRRTSQKLGEWNGQQCKMKGENNKRKKEPKNNKKRGRKNVTSPGNQG